MDGWTPLPAADPDSLACLGAGEIYAVSTETHSGDPDEVRRAIRSLLEALRSLLCAVRPLCERAVERH